MIYIPESVVSKVFKNAWMTVRANDINEFAQERVKYAYKDYENNRERTINTVNDLNVRKSKIIINQFELFIEYFKKVKNVEVNEIQGLTDISNLKQSLPDLEAMKNDVVLVNDFLVNGLKTYALGGFLVGGLIMSKKAQTAMNNAMANNAAADIQIESLKTAKVEMESVRLLAKQQDKTLRKLSNLSKVALASFKALIDEKDDWKTYNIDEKKSFTATVGLMKLLKEIIDQPILDEDGNIVEESKQLLENKDIAKLGIA